MSNYKVVDKDPNVFQRWLVPSDAHLARAALRKASVYSHSGNLFVRHVVSTMFATMGVALSFFNAFSYFFQIPFQMLYNIVRLDPVSLVKDFATSISSSFRSLLMGLFGVAYVAGGLFFPQTVYQFLSPVELKSMSDALDEAEKEAETLRKALAKETNRANLAEKRLGETGVTSDQHETAVTIDQQVAIQHLQTKLQEAEAKAADLQRQLDDKLAEEAAAYYYLQQQLAQSKEDDFPFAHLGPNLFKGPAPTPNHAYAGSGLIHTSDIARAETKISGSLQDSWIAVGQAEGHVNFITYLFKLWSADQLPADSTPIKFDTAKGEIIPHQDCSTLVFADIVKKTYGKSLIERLEKDYFKFNELNRITWGEVKQILVGIAAQVTVTDLKELFYDLKQSEPQLLIGKLIPPAEREAILAYQNFADIPADSPVFSYLLAAYRTVPVAMSETNPYARRKPIFELQDNRTLSQNIVKFDRYIHDLAVLRHAALATSGREATEAAVSEHFAKNYGYLDLSEGHIATQMNGVHYELKDQIEYQDDGLFCRIYAPINVKGPHTAHIVTRGTQWQPSRLSSGGSIRRDLNLRGVGVVDFENRKADIETLIRDYLKSSPTPVTLELDGHSLGAVDASRIMILIAEMIAKDHSLADKITKICLRGQNTPPLEWAANEAFKQSIRDLEETFEDLHQYRDGLFDIEFSHFYGDLIQNATYGVYLGAGINSGLVNRRIIRYQAPQGYTGSIHAAKPHTYHTGFTVVEGDDLSEFDKQYRGDIEESYLGFVQNRLGEASFFAAQMAISAVFNVGYGIGRLVLPHQR